MHSKKLRANFLLLLTAFIWGMAFVAQRQGVENCGPFLFNGTRSILGGAVLLPVIFLMDRKSPEKSARKWPISGGIWCGVVLFTAISLQQIGIIDAGAGKAGFITALYVVLVPVLGVFLRKKTSPIAWLSTGLALLGMYLLCMDGGAMALENSDLLLLGCALFFAVHIMVIDHFAPKSDCVRMACIQFFVCGILSLLVAVFTEEISFSHIVSAGIPILYTGILSSGVAYTLQIVAQKDTDPASAALICSLESVFALLGGWVLMQESFTGRELLGCAVTFSAILLSQLPLLLYRKEG